MPSLAFVSSLIIAPQLIRFRHLLIRTSENGSQSKNCDCKRQRPSFLSVNDYRNVADLSFRNSVVMHSQKCLHSYCPDEHSEHRPLKFPFVTRFAKWEDQARPRSNGHTKKNTQSRAKPFTPSGNKGTRLKFIFYFLDTALPFKYNTGCPSRNLSRWKPFLLIM